MADKLVIIMVNTDPRNGEELGAPFFQATVAAAMDYDVEVICTATAGQLMKMGVADKLLVKEGSPKTVYDFIKDAPEAVGRRSVEADGGLATDDDRVGAEVAEDGPAVE